MQPTPIQRLPTWAAELARLIEARAAVPFAWGPNDCAAWVADACAAQTGGDPLAELRGTRRTERGALRQLRAIGGVEAAIERAGLQPVPPALAQRGDVVMLDQGDWPLLALCMGTEALAPAATGLASDSMARATRAWRL